ncbi:hypothetical protein MP228_010929 [Amoeboaphelidium protococcarum]|nr:hypothetical protein MP228_010929 [Amoeboaphelidium protococcarum]
MEIASNFMHMLVMILILLQCLMNVDAVIVQRAGHQLVHSRFSALPMQVRPIRGVVRNGVGVKAITQPNLHVSESMKQIDTAVKLLFRGRQDIGDSVSGEPLASLKLPRENSELLAKSANEIFDQDTLELLIQKLIFQTEDLAATTTMGLVSKEQLKTILHNQRSVAVINAFSLLETHLDNIVLNDYTSFVYLIRLQYSLIDCLPIDPKVSPEQDLDLRFALTRHVGKRLRERLSVWVQGDLGYPERAYLFIIEAFKQPKDAKQPKVNSFIDFVMDQVSMVSVDLLYAGKWVRFNRLMIALSTTPAHLLLDLSISQEGMALFSWFYDGPNGQRLSLPAPQFNRHYQLLKNLSNMNLF